MPDSKAVKILFATYWSSNGWLNDRVISAEEFAYARSAGVMFDSKPISHNEAISRAIKAVSAVTPEQVSSAFLASLTTRRLDLRSALGSYAIGQHLRHHSWTGRGNCNECGGNDSPEPQDMNVLNFERLKWGGVRHGSPIYVALDLELFAQTEIPSVTKDDVKIFNLILETAKSLPPTARARDLEKAIGEFFKSNKAEREVLLQILGYAGVLESKGYPGFFKNYVPPGRRDLPPANRIDWTYPFAWWRGSDGLNQNAVSHWFSHELHKAT